MKKITNILSENKELFWDVSNLNALSEESIEERFLQYGNWKNILDLIKIFGIKKFTKIYVDIRTKSRSNLSKKTINFFNLYLDV